MPHQPSASPLIFYTDSTYFSGAEKSFAILAQSLAAKEYPVSLIVTPTVAERFSEYSTAEASAQRSKLAWSFYSSWVKRLRQEKPAAAVVNMWSPYANTLFLLAAHKAKIPCITIYHYYQEKDAVGGPLSPLKLYAYRLGEHLATRILTVSAAHRAVLIDDFGFPSAKVDILLNSTPPPPKVPTFEDHAPRRLLAIGSLEPAKGYDFLLNTLSLIPNGWALTVVGDGSERESLQAIATEKNLPVTFTGRQTNVDQYYNSHDILVHPSRFENLSMSIIESMSYGLACIANDVGGNRELITNGKTGWLLPLGDSEAWQKAIIEGCTTPLKPLRQTAYKRWQESFTVEKQTEAMGKELTRLIDGK